MTKRERKYHNHNRRIEILEKMSNANHRMKWQLNRMKPWAEKINVTVIPAPDKMPEFEKSITIYKTIYP